MSLYFILAYYSFTGSCPILLKVECHSCQTIVLCSTLFLSATSPHMWQPLCIYFFYFLPKTSQAVTVQLQELKACERPIERTMWTWCDMKSDSLGIVNKLHRKIHKYH